MTQIVTPAETYTPPEASVVLDAEAYFSTRPYIIPVHVMQYDDTMPILAVRLWNADKPYAVPAGAAVNVRMDKGDGTYIYNPALGVSADRCIAYISVTAQMAVVTGSHLVSIEIYKDGVAGTGTMRLAVDKNPVPEDAVESTDEFKTIQKLATETASAAEIIENNKDAINSLSDNVSAVKEAASNAATSAKAAATSEKNAATSESNAATSAKAAATSEKEAKAASGTITIVESSTTYYASIKVIDGEPYLVYEEATT